jgi:hypothetical protein
MEAGAADVRLTTEPEAGEGHSTGATICMCRFF